MTARDSYRRPVSSREAIEELRRVSGAQLDGRVVETFIGLLEKRSVTFRHADDADFERELNLDRRDPRLRAAARRGRVDVYPIQRPAAEAVNDNERPERRSRLTA